MTRAQAQDQRQYKDIAKRQFPQAMPGPYHRTVLSALRSRPRPLTPLPSTMPGLEPATRRSAMLCLLCGLLFVFAPTHAQAQGELELVSMGSLWTYWDQGTAPAADWTEITFDDTAWALGQAQLGYGENDEATVVDFGPNSADKYITTWFRHEFSILDANLWQSLRLNLLRDDGIAVHLNGQLLRRDRLPWTGYDADTLADGASDGAEEQALHTFDQGSALLVSGLNILAVEVHQADVTSEDLSFDLSMIARATPAVLRGPYLQVDTPTSMRVRWSTSAPTTSQVRFGPKPGLYLGSVGSPSLVTEHSILLTGLAPGTRYHYDLGTSAGLPLAGREFSFRTAPLPATAGSSSFWLIGDSGTANTFARAVRDGFVAGTTTTPDLWIMLGDNAYPQGDPAAYQRAVFDMYPEQLATIPVLSTRGNHDSDQPYFYELFDLPDQGQMGGIPSGSEAYYSLRWANIHLVCLDSEGTSRAVGDPMYTWLQADLAASDAEWLIAFWHHPPYSAGTHHSDTTPEEVEMRENFLPLLEDAGVDLVIAGHSHGYERSFQIDGHYDLSTSFDPQSMILDGGDGRDTGDGAYTRASGDSHDGTLYVVAGCSGDVRMATYNHPVMFISGAMLGSVVLDINDDRLDYDFIGPTGQIDDSFTLLHETYQDTYCDPTLNSEGCGATIRGEGVPSLSSSTPFLIHADQVVTNTFGFLVYGFAAGDLPLFEGSLCVAPPFGRRPPVPSGNGGACGGVLTEDFGTHLQSLADPALTVGTPIYAQFWYRDPASTTGSNFTQALSFVLQP
ncbi:MAG: hypothetical protein ACI8QC_004258 [Planctomycetota bacterium]|jgi:hypothetical protein